MEKEIEHSTNLGVMMVCAVILIGAIASILTISRGFGNRALESAQVAIGENNSELQRLVGTVTEQNAAAAQLLICQNNSSINFYDSKVRVMLYGDTNYTDLSDIMNNAHGNVILEVQEDRSGVIVNVHRYNCDIAKLHGTCNCNSKVR